VERPIVVAVFDRGELKSVRALSPERERWAATVAGVASAGLVLGGMAAAAALLHWMDLVVHGPTFFLSWVGVAAAVAIVTARWARNRAGRYRLGADIDADAFAMHSVDFVRRAGSDYEVGLLPGMSGSIEQGGRSLPLEALTRKGAVHLPLPATGKVRLEAGHITFVIARRSLGGAERGGWRDSVDWLAERIAQRLVRAAALGTPVAALVTMLGAVPAAMAVTENDVRWKIPSNASRPEVEQLIRTKAQFESGTLHQCFDNLPLSCQRPGYVGVGLSLSREGEVISHWVARSTFDEECPVTRCMEDVVASWSFQPMRERMTMVLPIQVRRTHKPLWQARDVEVVTPAERSAVDVGDAGATFIDSDSGRLPY
jgi:hypothetical protein